MIVIINTLNLAERLRSLQEDEHSKLTIGAFFEFMRTAYQVNDSFEGLSTILSSNSEIDWHELARINLDVAKCEDNKVNNDNLSVQEGNKDANLMQDLLLQTISSKETYASENAINFQSSVTSCSSGEHQSPLHHPHVVQSGADEESDEHHRLHHLRRTARSCGCRSRGGERRSPAHPALRGQIQGTHDSSLLLFLAARGAPSAPA